MQLFKVTTVGSKASLYISWIDASGPDVDVMSYPVGKLVLNEQRKKTYTHTTKGWLVKNGAMTWISSPYTKPRGIV